MRLSYLTPQKALGRDTMPPSTKCRGRRDADVRLSTHSWDIENRLTVVQLPAGTRTAASYDGDGKRRRYEDNQDALLRNSLWDGENSGVHYASRQGSVRRAGLWCSGRLLRMRGGDKCRSNLAVAQNPVWR